MRSFHALPLAFAILTLSACATAGPAPAPAIAAAHIITAGSKTPAPDLDACLNDTFTGMAGQWTMRFAKSGPGGAIDSNQGTLTIKPKTRDRWIIQRPGPSGAMQDFSEITHYGDGQMESVRLAAGAQTIFEERYLECHTPDASGRAKFVSTLDQRLRRGGPMMRTTRTGWVSAGHIYSIDVSEALDGSGEYALSTRFGTRAR
jgi:hypothetical protein